MSKKVVIEENVIDEPEESREEIIEQIKTVLAQHPEYKTKQVVEALGSTGLSSKELYNLVLKIKK